MRAGPQRASGLSFLESLLLCQVGVVDKNERRWYVADLGDVGNSLRERSSGNTTYKAVFTFLAE